MSKEPVFVSIVSEDAAYNNLSGEYIFHSIQNKAAAYVRNGRVFNPNPELCYSNSSWYVGFNSLKLSDEKMRYWLKLQTQGLLYFIAYWTYNNNNQKRI